MNERCEVCENMRPDGEAPGARELETVSFGGESVVLCSGHARIAQNAGVVSFETLRELYGAGRRSFVPRRRPSSFAPLAERRSERGRRASDSGG